MDSPSHISSILTFYSSPPSLSYPSPFYSNTSITTPPLSLSYSSSISPLFPSYDSPFYSTTHNTNAIPSPNHFYTNETSTPNLSLSQNSSPLSASYNNLYGSENPRYSGSDIPIFNGTGDGYWWILCIERYFKARGTPDAAKVSVAVTALQGSALQWWLEKHHHSKLSWESFTAVFLWWFKPEYRDVLPLLEDDKEEVNNNKSLCLSFQPHTTVTHGSKEHGGDEKEPESEGVEEEESEEQRDDEEGKPIIVQKDLKEEEDSDSQFFTSGKEDESVAEADLLSTRTSIVLKDSDKGDNIFSDEVSPSLSCDIVIPILCDVNFLCDEPPPPPKPPDHKSICPRSSLFDLQQPIYSLYKPSPPPKPPEESCFFQGKTESFFIALFPATPTLAAFPPPPPKPPDRTLHTMISSTPPIFIFFHSFHQPDCRAHKSFSSAFKVGLVNFLKQCVPSDSDFIGKPKSQPSTKSTICVLCQQLISVHHVRGARVIILMVSLSSGPQNSRQLSHNCQILNTTFHITAVFKRIVQLHALSPRHFLCNRTFQYGLLMWSHKSLIKACDNSNFFQNFPHAPLLSFFQHLSINWPFSHCLWYINSSWVINPATSFSWPFWLHGFTVVSFENLLVGIGFAWSMSKGKQMSSTKEWDPGGQNLVFTMIGYLQFKQWDPGKFVNTSIFLQP